MHGQQNIKLLNVVLLAALFLPNNTVTQLWACNNHISLSECNIGTIQKLPFAVNSTIELKNTKATYDSNVAPVS
jgi:hypothetical protein